MPSGKTHDAITILLSVPTFAFAYRITDELNAPMILTAGFLFGGFIFGPDLDTVSRQYRRWGIFRFLWLPYRVIIEHRSRLSHGLIFGAAFRVIYFAGVTTLFLFAVAYVLALKANMQPPGFIEILESWKGLISQIEKHFGEGAPFYFFGGIWLGSASHTLTDVAITFIKTGKVKNFL
ncbi:MAG: metal-binding protein [Pyrinomonadaceae bacterium]|nr:metal-binding protein [Pyrinomonadaceae bacterium]MCX7638970.1 metal-binding protein [Pyrinomonadaceae bacterium]MDW8303811.1 metal-binding protein [Acidobacteriota bacterium]